MKEDRGIREAETPAPMREFAPEVAIVLGSGLATIADRVENPLLLDYSDVPGLPRPAVPGHPARFVMGTMPGGVRAVFAQGRAHLYEGWTAREAAAGVRLMAAAGARLLILTNAAGSLDPRFAPGTWMQIADHINLLGDSPLEGAPTFADLGEVYSRRLRELFRFAARETGLHLGEGVYAAVRGPHYETPAEARMLHGLGAHAVGMSTVPEAIQARALEIEVAGFSCLTNFAAGIHHGAVDHEQVTKIGEQAAETLLRLLEFALPQAVRRSEPTPPCSLT